MHAHSVIRDILASTAHINFDATHQETVEALHASKRPKFIEFRNELPKTNVGKILRRELRDEAMKKRA